MFVHLCFFFLTSLSLFSCSVVSNFLQPCGLQHTRLPWPSLSPGVCSDSCPLSWWCYLTISSFCCLLLLLPSIFPSFRVFSNVWTLLIRWGKYWSFSFSIRSSNEYSGLICFRIDWFDVCAVQGTLKSLLQHYSSKTNSLALSLLYGPTLTSVHYYWKHSFH